MNIIKTSLLVITSCVLSQCASMHAASANKNSEPLDLIDLKDKLNNYPKDKNLMQSAIDANPIYEGEVEVYFEKGDLSIRILEIPISGVEYSEYNRKNGAFLYLFGEETRGYERATGNKKSALVTIKDYYPNGKINEIRQLYSTDYPVGVLKLEAYGNNSLPHVAFPIGKILTYDENGALIKSIDCDRLFKFKAGDVKKLLKQKKANINLAQISGMVEQDGAAMWGVSYHTLIDGDCYIVIDARSGKIVSEEQHLEDRKKHPLV